MVQLKKNKQEFKKGDNLLVSWSEDHIWSNGLWDQHTWQEKMVQDNSTLKEWKVYCLWTEEVNKEGKK